MIQYIILSVSSPASALFTAATWYHRFYMRYSIEDFHRQVSVMATCMLSGILTNLIPTHFYDQDVAVACIFLSTKTEECGRKLRDVAKVYKSKIIGCSSEQISDAVSSMNQEFLWLLNEIGVVGC